jgi:hypothetical protein
MIKGTPTEQKCMNVHISQAEKPQSLAYTKTDICTFYKMILLPVCYF